MSPRSVLLLQLLACASARTSPRLKLSLIDIIQAQCKFTSTEEYSTTLRDGSTIYVGGKEILYEINLGKPCILHKLPKDDEAKKKCQEKKLGHCDNVIMVLQKFNSTHLLLCGTNAWKPKCWLFFDKKFDSMINGRSRPLGNGVCPFTPKHGFASLVEDERLYSVAPLYEKGEGKLLRGYKKSSTAQWLLSIDNWLQDPHFVGMSAMDDQVFMFFREKYLPTNLDIDPWISRIARVCKDDLGGSSQRLQSKWATFLKARLLCNIPADHVHFNTIQNVFVARSKNSDARVYGIFSSNWNGTAICSYSMEDINKVFGTSKFKGFAEAIPDPRPGTCGTDTQNLRDKVLNVVENHPEMKTDVHPIGNHPLVMDMEKVFQLIVVDSVVAVNGKVSRVLFLTMDDGKIQKVLEVEQSVFTISELTVLEEQAPILSMSLDSETEFLYVTTTKEVIQIPVAHCEKYNTTCEDCVMTRDPYCAWNTVEKKCVRTANNSNRHLIQDVEHGDNKRCPQEKASYHSGSREGGMTKSELRLEGNGPVYLSCPKQSHHADYSWTVDNNVVMTCSSNEDNCLLFIQDLSDVNGVRYVCNSNERGHQQLHMSYALEGSAPSIHLSSYSVAVYSALMTAAALVLH